MAEQLLYRPEEAAQVLGIGRAKLFQLIGDGTVASVQIGRSRRITRRALEEYVSRLSETQGAA